MSKQLYSWADRRPVGGIRHVSTSRCRKTIRFGVVTVVTPSVVCFSIARITRGDRSVT